MTIETTNSSYITTYTDKEWDFIETLDNDKQRLIKMGLATPYDFGFCNK